VKTCSVEGCDREVLARGWCGRHYSRWHKNGDPLVISPRLKGDPNASVESSRFIRGTQVFFTVDGRSFIEIQRVRKGQRVTGRRYGFVFVCEQCKRETFAKAGGANRLRFCSHKCAGPSSSHAKLGRTKSTSTKAKVDHLDRLFSVLIRSAGVCVHCGATDRLQCAHGFSRRYRSVRWDFRNAFCLCQRCHMFFTHRPLEWDEWLRARWGDDLYTEVRRLALSTTKADLDVIRESLVAETKRRGVTANRLPKGAEGWLGLAS
jgi:hypothetical protein